MRISKKNEVMKNLITQLKTAAIKNEAPIWKAVASELEKPTRNRRVVNLCKLSKNTKENDLIIVPGKILSVGELSHNVTVAALGLSTEAKRKISKVGKVVSIEELVKLSPKGSKVRIIG